MEPDRSAGALQGRLVSIVGRDVLCVHLSFGVTWIAGQQQGIGSWAGSLTGAERASKETPEGTEEEVSVSKLQGALPRRSTMELARPGEIHSPESMRVQSAATLPGQRAQI